MIKNYKLFKESLLNKLEGPNEEEIWNNIKEMKPEQMIYKSIQSGLIKGVKLAIKQQPDLLNHKFVLNEIVESDNTEMLKTYLKYGGIISDKDNYLLRLALSNRNYEMCKIIIDNLSEETIIPDLTLIKLAGYGNHDIIKYFVDKFPVGAKLLLKNVDHSIENFGISHPYKTKEYLQSKISTNESLLNKLEGPSEEEIKNNLKDKFLFKSGLNYHCIQNYIYKCEKYGIEPDKNAIFNKLNIDGDFDNVDDYLDYIISNLKEDIYYINNNSDLKYYTFKHHIVMVLNKKRKVCLLSRNYFYNILNIFNIKATDIKLDLLQEKIKNIDFIPNEYELDIRDDYQL